MLGECINFQLSNRHRNQAFVTNINILRSIGIVIVLWYVSHVFNQSIVAIDRAGKATFEAVEAAAIVSKQNFD